MDYRLNSKFCRVLRRPVERVITDSQLLAKVPCQHVLRFQDTERYRVQLIADLYRQFTQSIEMRTRDDKLATAIFYLADFLLKFHRRAFSWSDLERVDELASVHRTPDLRVVLAEMLKKLSERYLYTIRNGLYDYRFSSDFARELEYISHQSEPELAAFNFALDESQHLKKFYREQIQELGAQNVYELQTALGELHDFDEEYEMARYYYRHAIRALDEELRYIFPNEAGTSIVAKVLQSDPDGLKNARRTLTWGIARLRLMMQIGMTYERAKNFERAHVEYRDARTLSRSMMRTMLDLPGLEIDLSSSSAEKLSGKNNLQTMKELHILFQPIWAQAWVCEKLAFGIDTGTSLVEQQLKELRTILPFLREQKPQSAKSTHDLRHANFALIASEMHNKAGNLYFWKGRQTPQLSDIKLWSSFRSKERLNAEGYMLRAMYHYFIALHEVRRYNFYRRTSSRNKFNLLLENRKKLFSTVKERSWPDFACRVAAGALGNLLDGMLARVSLSGLIHSIGNENFSGKDQDPQIPAQHNKSGENSADKDQDPDHDINSYFSQLIEQFQDWMECEGAPPSDQEIQIVANILCKEKPQKIEEKQDIHPVKESENERNSFKEDIIQKLKDWRESFLNKSEKKEYPLKQYEKEENRKNLHAKIQELLKENLTRIPDELEEKFKKWDAINQPLVLPYKKDQKIAAIQLPALTQWLGEWRFLDVQEKKLLTRSVIENLRQTYQGKNFEEELEKLEQDLFFNAEYSQKGFDEQVKEIFKKHRFKGLDDRIKKKLKESLEFADEELYITENDKGFLFAKFLTEFPGEDAKQLNNFIEAIPKKGKLLDLEIKLKEFFPSPGTHLSWHEVKKIITDHIREQGIHQLLEFKTSHNDYQRLFFGLICGLVGANCSKQAGYFEEAAQGYVKIVEFIQNYVWWYVIIKNIISDRQMSEQNVWGKFFQQFQDTSMNHQFWSCLFEFALFALKEADDLYKKIRPHRTSQEKQDSPHNQDGSESSNYLVGITIPRTTLTLVCSFGMAVEQLQQPKKNVANISRQLWNNFIVKWTALKEEADPNFRQQLLNALDRHSYPLKNRLNGLKVLVLDASLKLNREVCRLQDHHLRHVKELMELQALYQSPLHFTPFDSGLALSVFYLSV